MSSMLVTREDIDNRVWNQLKEIYKNCTEPAILTACSLAKADGIDPLLKPWYILKFGSTEQHHPSIWRHRFVASKTGLYVGNSSPIFGKEVYDEKSKTSYPEWCEITVKKIINNHIGEFSAREYWVEIANGSNAMWKKRPHGQLAKCTEAQALRKAFPDICGDYTYEEMLPVAEEKTDNQSNSNISFANNTPSKLNLDSLKEKALQISSLCKSQGIDPAEFAKQYGVSSANEESLDQGLFILKNKVTNAASSESKNL